MSREVIVCSKKDWIFNYLIIYFISNVLFFTFSFTIKR